jgi:hypothetical protein
MQGMSDGKYSVSKGYVPRKRAEALKNGGGKYNKDKTVITTINP